MSKQLSYSKSERNIYIKKKETLITFAIVKVLPVPVVPNKTCYS